MFFKCHKKVNEILFQRVTFSVYSSITGCSITPRMHVHFTMLCSWESNAAVLKYLPPDFMLKNSEAFLVHVSGIQSHYVLLPYHTAKTTKTSIFWKSKPEAPGTRVTPDGMPGTLQFWGLLLQAAPYVYKPTTALRRKSGLGMINTGCSMSIRDREFWFNQVPSNLGMFAPNYPSLLTSRRTQFRFLTRPSTFPEIRCRGRGGIRYFPHHYCQYYFGTPRTHKGLIAAVARDVRAASCYRVVS